MESSTIQLSYKASATLAYSFIQGRGILSQTHLIVFLNGLMLPKAAWGPSIKHFLQDSTENGLSFPALLSYDRYGQGDSDRDPTDKDDGYGHDLTEVVRDLHVLIREVLQSKAAVPTSDQQSDTPKEATYPGPTGLPKLIFVANSIGCAVGRLFAETYPGTVSGLLLLDTNVTNTDFVSVFPDPDAAGFDPTGLPDGVTASVLRETRAKCAAAFHPSVKNREGLDRRNISQLLPNAHKPQLQGAGSNKGPWITVVGHDWDAFAQEGLRGPMGMATALTNLYINPAWSEYNKGMLQLTNSERAEGPVIAKGCGHFIQRDDPLFVATAIRELLAKVQTDASSEAR
ncbi:Alpha/Beta hydrolase protein [Xylariales sp. PMI_506]|nr:Alpha/Beta hydrolase protein [Xylariales sp. PMI_506]